MLELLKVYTLEANLRILQLFAELHKTLKHFKAK